MVHQRHVVRKTGLYTFSDPNLAFNISARGTIAIFEGSSSSESSELSEPVSSESASSLEVDRPTSVFAVGWLSTSMGSIGPEPTTSE